MTKGKRRIPDGYQADGPGLGVASPATTASLRQNRSPHVPEKEAASAVSPSV